LERQGCWVRMPTFDDNGASSLAITFANREMIEWAEEVHMFSNLRSIGTMINWGMAFALRKRVRIMHLGSATLTQAVEGWEEWHKALLGENR